MVKRSMDKDTILFVHKDKGSIAFNIGYYRNNYDKFSNIVADPKEIYYKMGDTTDTWIDYRRAVQTKTGSLSERLQQAFLDPSYRITDLRLIPEAFFYDADGYRFLIPPYDNEYNSSYWLKKVEFNYNDITYELDGDHLIVTFSSDDNINDALISLNTMFYNYELINYHTIVFKNVRPLLPRVQLVDDKYHGYDIRVQVYAWHGLDKQPLITPIRRDNNWFELQVPIEENCFIIYRGIMYEYELNYNDKKKFKLMNVDAASLDMFNIDEIYVYRMIHEEPNKAARKFITRGIGNKYRDTVDFALPIQDSLILFNGVDSEYEIIDDAAIFYPKSLFSVRHVSNLSFVAQVNFTLGM